VSSSFTRRCCRSARVERIAQPSALNASISIAPASRHLGLARGADDARRPRPHRGRPQLPASRAAFALRPCAAGRACSARQPKRDIESARCRVNAPPRASAQGLTFASSDLLAAVLIEVPDRLVELRLRIHLRRAYASFIVWRGRHPAPICRSSPRSARCTARFASTTGSSSASAGPPAVARLTQLFMRGSPRARIRAASRSHAHTLGQARPGFRDVGDERALGRHDRFSPDVNTLATTPNLSTEPLSFDAAVVRSRRPSRRRGDRRARLSCLPAAYTQATTAS